MSYFKLAEIVGGLGVAAVGLLGIIGALLLPAQSQTVTTSQKGQFIGQHQQNIWLLQELGTPRAVSVLATVGVLAVVVAIASLLHVSHRFTIDLFALWGATLLLVGTVIISSQWTTYLFLPAAFVAVVTAVLATIYQLLTGNGNRKTPASP